MSRQTCLYCGRQPDKVAFGPDSGFWTYARHKCANRPPPLPLPQDRFNNAELAVFMNANVAVIESFRTETVIKYNNIKRFKRFHPFKFDFKDYVKIPVDKESSLSSIPYFRQDSISYVILPLTDTRPDLYRTFCVYHFSEKIYMPDIINQSRLDSFSELFVDFNSDYSKVSTSIYLKPDDTINNITNTKICTLTYNHVYDGGHDEYGMLNYHRLMDVEIEGSIYPNAMYWPNVMYWPYLTPLFKESTTRKCLLEFEPMTPLPRQRAWYYNPPTVLGVFSL